MTNRKIKEVLGPSGSTSITSIHQHEYRGKVLSSLNLVYEVREPAGMVLLFRRHANNPKGGRRYGANGPSWVPSNRSQKCQTGPRGYKESCQNIGAEALSEHHSKNILFSP